MSMDIENGIEQVILGLADSMERDAKSDNAEQLNELRQRFLDNEELYDAEIAVAFGSFETIAATPFLEAYGVTDSRRKNISCYIYGQQIPHFLRKTIKSKEGTPFSADKEHFIIRKLKDHIITGENQSLYATYKDEDEQAYWSPKTFKDTDEVLEAFFSWYNVEEAKMV